MKNFITKTIFFLWAITFCFSANAQSEIDFENCTFNGIPLYGKVQIVNSFPDFKVEIVNAFPDLKVQKVNAFPDACGEWQFVDAFPDFTIQLVSNFAEVKIEYVTAFPGMEE
jgi:uncharacterized protein YlzI (FlbEa/FlbD family)